MFRLIRWYPRRYFVPAAVSAVAIALLGSQFANFSLSNSRQSSADAHADEPSGNADPIILHAASTTRYEFGTLNRGARAERTFRLHNPGPAAVTVSKITTSCECLRVQLAKHTIGPEESTSGTVIVDFRDEPQFAGGLLLLAEGWTDGKKTKPAFTVQVKVSVR